MRHPLLDIIDRETRTAPPDRINLQRPSLGAGGRRARGRGIVDAWP